MPRPKEFKNPIKVCTVFPKVDLELIEEQAERNGMNRSQLIRGAVNKILPKTDEMGGVEDNEE